MAAHINESQLGPWWPKWRNRVALAIAILSGLAITNLFMAIAALVRE